MRGHAISGAASLALAWALAGCTSAPPSRLPLGGPAQRGGAISPALPPPLPSNATDLPVADVERARRLYVAKCANCHRFYPPANYPDSEWAAWMEKMGQQARLQPDEARLLGRFLGAFRPPGTVATPPSAR